MGTRQDLAEFSQQEIEKVIDAYIHHERNRAIYKRRMLDGICFEPLAEEFPMSVRQVKNIVYKCDKTVLRRLRQVITAQ